MLYTLLTPAASDGSSESSIVIDSSNPMEGSSVLNSGSASSDDTTNGASGSDSGNTSSTTSSPEAAPVGGCLDKENIGRTLTGWGIALLLIGGYYLLNKRSMKKRQEYIDRRNNIQPGNKVMTIGGITGTVVEVNPNDNTFVLETGSDELGKSYLRFDKAAIHDTDVAIEPEQTQPVEEVTVTPEQEPVIEQEDELFDETNKPETTETEEVEEIVESVEETTEEDTVDEE